MLATARTSVISSVKKARLINGTTEGTGGQRITLILGRASQLLYKMQPPLTGIELWVTTRNMTVSAISCHTLNDRSIIGRVK